MKKKITEPLHGINVFDLTRVLAGPTSTQILGDLGANIIKVERPNSGDDSRNLGPPYLDGSSESPQESSYFLGVNRNENSVTIDLTKQEGQTLAKKIIKILTCFLFFHELFLHVILFLFSSLFIGILLLPLFFLNPRTLKSYSLNST